MDPPAFSLFDYLYHTLSAFPRDVVELVRQFAKPDDERFEVSEAYAPGLGPFEVFAFWNAEDGLVTKMECHGSLGVLASRTHCYPNRSAHVVWFLPPSTPLTSRVSTSRASGYHENQIGRNMIFCRETQRMFVVQGFTVIAYDLEHKEVVRIELENNDKPVRVALNTQHLVLLYTYKTPRVDVYDLQSKSRVKQWVWGLDMSVRDVSFGVGGTVQFLLLRDGHFYLYLWDHKLTGGREILIPTPPNMLASDKHLQLHAYSIACSRTSNDTFIEACVHSKEGQGCNTLWDGRHFIYRTCI